MAHNHIDLNTPPQEGEPKTLTLARYMLQVAAKHLELTENVSFVLLMREDDDKQNEHNARTLTFSNASNAVDMLRIIMPVVNNSMRDMMNITETILLAQSADMEEEQSEMSDRSKMN